MVAGEVEGPLVTLVIGGARSGKSEVAERIAAAAGLPVTYVATGPGAIAGDPEWAERVAAHRARRPAGWRTEEVPEGGDLGAALAGAAGAALVDSLGTWVAGFDGFDVPAARLHRALGARAAAGLPTVVVSEEVGLGVHAPTEAGRRFADALGALNQAVASTADRVLLVVAGRGLDLGRVAG